MVKIYTKTGDSGETSLLGGKRVKKSCLEIDAIGDVDELNTLVGVVVSKLEGLDQAKEKLSQVQHRLFTIGSNIADVQMQLGNIPKLKDSDITTMESWIDNMHESLEPLKNFVLPGGHEAASFAYMARAICRRAERRVVELQQSYPELDPLVQKYLNRLSDVLFTLARWINKQKGESDIAWQK